MILTALLSVCLLHAGATEIFTAPGPSNVTIAPLNYLGPGPQSGPNYTWTSTNAVNQGGAVFGYTGTYGYGSNGIWDGQLGPMAGLNDSFAYYGITDSMTFAFTTPVYEVGGFINYFPNGTTPTTIAVYDTSDDLIESATLSFLTGGSTDTGEWLGFQETTPIGYFTLTDNYIGITDMVTESSPEGTVVPEPGTMALLGSGILALAWAARKKRVQLKALKIPCLGESSIANPAT